LCANPIHRHCSELTLRVCVHAKSRVSYRSYTNMCCSRHYEEDCVAQAVQVLVLW